MILSKETASKILINIKKAVTKSTDISIINSQGIIIESTNTSETGLLRRNALKALASNSTTVIEIKDNITTSTSYIELLIPILINEVPVAIVEIGGYEKTIFSHKGAVKAIAELILDETPNKNNSSIQKNSDQIISMISHSQFQRRNPSPSITPDSEPECVAVVFDISHAGSDRDLNTDQIQQVLYHLSDGDTSDIIEITSPRQLVMLKRIEVNNNGWNYKKTMQRISRDHDILSNIQWLNINTSCGDRYVGEDRLAISYQSAVQSLTIGKALFPEQKIYSYKKMALDVLLQSTSKDWTSEHLANSYNNLISRDKNGSLQKTLKCLFRANLSAGKAAKDLHVHRNTLRYRLERIQDYTGMDINDIDNLFMLYSAFKLNRINAATT